MTTIDWAALILLVLCVGALVGKFIVGPTLLGPHILSGTKHWVDADDIVPTPGLSWRDLNVQYYAKFPERAQEDGWNIAEQRYNFDPDAPNVEADLSRYFEESENDNRD